jgi:hypothetical protein
MSPIFWERIHVAVIMAMMIVTATAAKPTVAGFMAFVLKKLCGVKKR